MLKLNLFGLNFSSLFKKKDREKKNDAPADHSQFETLYFMAENFEKTQEAPLKARKEITNHLKDKNEFIYSGTLGSHDNHEEWEYFVSKKENTIAYRYANDGRTKYIEVINFDHDQKFIVYPLETLCVEISTIGQGYKSAYAEEIIDNNSMHVPEDNAQEQLIRTRLDNKKKSFSLAPKIK